MRQNSISAIRPLSQEGPVAGDLWYWIFKGIRGSVDSVDMISPLCKVGSSEAVVSIISTMYSILQYMQRSLSLSDDYGQRWQHKFSSIIALILVFNDVMDSQVLASYFRSQWEWVN